MEQIYYVVFDRDYARPFKIRAKHFVDFMEQLNRAVLDNGPFEFIYRGYK